MAKKQKAPVEAVPKMVVLDGLEKKYKYDTEVIGRFIDFVFGENLSENENILFFMTNTETLHNPLYEDNFFTIVEKTRQPFAMFYGASTMKADRSSLLNRPDLFSALHVIVTRNLTKDAPKPSYIIDCGDGTKEYGFVLSEPVKSLPIARTLYQLFYEAGLLPEGANSPHSVLRLPEGVTGKIGKHRFNRLSLESISEKKYEPNELAELLVSEVVWDKVLTSPYKPLLKLPRHSAGLLPYQPVSVLSGTLEGVIDPLLEWLYNEKFVKQEINEDVSLICPWIDKHIKGSDTAIYSPIGRGKRKLHREFKCENPMCLERNIGSLLSWASKNDAPMVGAHDKTPYLLAKWAYDSSENAVWSFASDSPRIYTMVAFKNLHPESVKHYDGKWKMKKSAVYRLWLNSKFRVVVGGQKIDPSVLSPIIQMRDELIVNTVHRVNWGIGEFDMSEVDVFLDFVGYLIPIKEEREYFLDWVACKVQDMGFRGCAMLMIAKNKQGTGRNTLASILTHLYGAANCENIDFIKLIGHTNESWTDWKEKPFVITDETFAIESDKTITRVYEIMKGVIDPRPKEVRINPKYGRERMSMIHSSFMLMSNNEAAVKFSDSDRRLYVISNPVVARDADYFKKLNEWIERYDENGLVVWGKHLHRYFLKRPVDVSQMLAPPKPTAAKLRMYEANMTNLEICIEGILDICESSYITVDILRKIILMFKSRINYSQSVEYDIKVLNILKSKTIEMFKGAPIRFDGKTHRIRGIISKFGEAQIIMQTSILNTEKERYQVKRHLSVLTDNDNIKELVNKVNRYMDSHERR